MAEAARSVIHYVSDCLEERHPYDVRKGFAGRPERDAGKVYDGHLPAGGLDHLLNSLSDPSVGDAELTRAVRFLYGNSSTQEVKIELLLKGVVPSVVAVLNHRPSPLLAHQCFLLLWSLSVLPQGCHQLVHCGGLAAAMRAIASPADRADAAVMQEREAAAKVAAQVASNFAGLRWMLRAEDCSEFVLSGADCSPADWARPAGPSASPADGAPSPDPAELVAVLTDALAAEAPGSSRVGLHCSTCLAHITSVAPGIHLATGMAVTSGGATLLPLVVGQIRALLQFVAAAAASTGVLEWGPEVAYLVQALTIVWNVAMDQGGLEMFDSIDRTAPALFDLFAVVKAMGFANVPMPLHRALSGAVSAVSKLSSVKLASTYPLSASAGFDAGRTRISTLLAYLQEINAAVAAQKARGVSPPSNDLIATSKNVVQSIRLASEVRPVRDVTHVLLSKLNAIKDSTEGFYFRRQLYCATQWELEYDASA